MPSDRSLDPLTNAEEPALKIRLLDSLLVDVIPPGSQPTNEMMELTSYFNEPLYTADPLAWWKTNEGKFPRIAKLARKYLAIPASEVASERSFSVAGLTVSKLRSALDPDNVDQLTFLHHNHNYHVPIDLTNEQKE